jgi:SET domain-containing protein
MMLIRTRVQPSEIHGMGLFAVEPIARGTAVWRCESGFDRAYSAAQFAALPAEAQRHLRWFAFLDSASGNWVLSGDHACFMNHSLKPNTGALADAKAPVTTIALRDIAAGEELTCDYFAFDAEASRKLG